MSTGPVAAPRRPPPPGGDNARSMFLRGSAWTLFDYGSSQLVRLASNTILWRLLHEADFGLMTLVTTLMIGLGMFSDVGIGPSIVQHERGDDPDYLNTAWTIQVLRGSGLFLIALLMAVPAGHFFHQPMLTRLLLMVALTPLLQGFNSTNLFSASRRLALRQLTLVDFSAQLVGTTAMLIVAWVTRSVYSLTVTWVLTAALRLALGHLVLPGIRNRFRWEPSAVAALIHFGRWVFVSTLLTFFAMNLDRLVFGKVLTMAALGVYGIAGTWATLPATVLGRVFSTVAFPLLSLAKNRGEPVGPVFRDTRDKVLMLGAWATTGLIAGAAPLIHLLYDKRAVGAIWIIPLLAAGNWFSALENTNSNAALSLGRPKWLAAANGAKVAGMAVLVPLGGLIGGLPGAIIGLSLADLVKYVISAVGAVRVSVSAWRQDIVLTVEIIAVAAATLAVRKLVRADHLPAIVDALVVTVLVSGAWGTLFWWRRRTVARTPVTDLGK